jgi:hypothetical protein
VSFEEANVTLEPLSVSPALVRVQVPAQVDAGVNTVTLTKQVGGRTGTRESTSDPFSVIVQPVIANVEYTDGARSDAAQSVICMDIFPLPKSRQRLSLWVNASSREAAEDHRFVGPLMFIVDTTAEKLTQGNPDAVRESFSKQGISLSRRAGLVADSGNGQWIVEDKGRYFAIRSVGGEFLCFHGFSHKPSANRIAFSAVGMRPGSYLVRVQVGDQQFAESHLIRGTDPASPEFGKYIGPMVSVA